MRIQPSLRDRFFISCKHNLLFSIYYDHSFDTGEAKIIYVFLNDGAGTNQKFDVCLPELIINSRILTTRCVCLVSWFVNDFCAL